MKNPQKRKSKRTNLLGFSIMIGFFAGLIWGGVKGLFYYLRFTTVIPGFLVEPFFKHSFLNTQPGYYVGWLSFILFSIVATLVYTLAFRKLRGPFPGLVYGIVWWMLIFVVIGPLAQITAPESQLSFDTLFSEFCLYLLWGLFIGYSTAEEFTDERNREPERALE